MTSSLDIIVELKRAVNENLSVEQLRTIEDAIESEKRRLLRLIQEERYTKIPSLEGIVIPIRTKEILPEVMKELKKGWDVKENGDYPVLYYKSLNSSKRLED